MEFAAATQKTATAALNALSLGRFVKANASKAQDKWDMHNEYEKAVVERWYNELLAGSPG